MCDPLGGGRISREAIARNRDSSPFVPDNPARVGIECKLQSPQFDAVGAQLHSNTSVHKQGLLPATVIVAAHEDIDIGQLAQHQLVFIVK